MANAWQSTWCVRGMGSRAHRRWQSDIFGWCSATFQCEARLCESMYTHAVPCRFELVRYMYHMFSFHCPPLVHPPPPHTHTHTLIWPAYGPTWPKPLPQQVGVGGPPNPTCGGFGPMFAMLATSGPTMAPSGRTWPSRSWPQMARACPCLPMLVNVGRLLRHVGQHGQLWPTTAQLFRSSRIRRASQPDWRGISGHIKPFLGHLFLCGDGTGGQLVLMVYLLTSFLNMYYSICLGVPVMFSESCNTLHGSLISASLGDGR